MAQPIAPSQCAHHRWMWVAEVHENSPKSAQQRFCVVNWVVTVNSDILDFWDWFCVVNWAVDWVAARHTHAYFV